MNEAQLKIIKRCIKLEKQQAEYMEGEDEKARQNIKKIFHSDAMRDFKKAARPKNPNPPTKLTDKACSTDCFFCNPELLQYADQDFNRN